MWHLEVGRERRRSLGRCEPAKGEIRIARWLWEEAPELLPEVLCHELAHVAVFELYGRGPKPHGPEWKELVRRAGYEPRLRLAVAGEADARIPRSLRPASRPLYEHRCPVCHRSRLARKRVTRWRCRECVEAGLDGRLEIRSLPGTS